eukprot:scaffold16811_cov97-Isochrysis_galbana.AAC.4
MLCLPQREARGEVHAHSVRGKRTECTQCGGRGLSALSPGRPRAFDRAALAFAPRFRTRLGSS